jgi:esterase/lipase superfamily enzyme
MVENYKKFYSQNMNAEVEMLVCGESGYPVIAFPTSMGNYDQNKDFGLVKSAAELIDAGKIRLYCIGSIDKMSYYAENLHPMQRIHNYTLYDKFLYEELVPQILQETGYKKIAVAGCSFGGYHAANFAFRHPDKTGFMISMSGAFDIRPRLDGFYNDDVYFNNPPDFLPGASDPALWDMGIILGTSDQDFCRAANEKLSEVLNSKGIGNWLDIRMGEPHDWPAWCRMFPDYLKRILE